MAAVPVDTAKKPPARRGNPLLFVGCGLALIAGGGLLQWMEPGAADKATTTEISAETASRIAAVKLRQAREREERERAEQERIAAEEAAEKARRVMALADSATEAAARAQREEMAKRQSAAREAQRTAEETEDAWKRFYKPSAACRDGARSATVECVNEYVKAKREFENRRVDTASR